MSNKEILNFDFSKMKNVSGYYYLGDYEQFNFIDMQCQFSDLDASDCHVYFVEKPDVNAVQWNFVPTLDHIIPSGSCSREMINADFGSKIVGIYINKGTVKCGILKIWIIVKNQI